MASADSDYGLAVAANSPMLPIKILPVAVTVRRTASPEPPNAMFPYAESCCCSKRETANGRVAAAGSVVFERDVPMAVLELPVVLAKSA